MDKASLEAVALTIRSLAMDAVEKANSGHPGLPMGCAELGALLYGEILNHYPAEPGWINRDRFVLSAGHGSMLLYALLYLSGYGLTLDDIKNFRQAGSPTAGHPEYGMAKGIETTTGPLGQGLSNAVGMAIAEQMLASRFNTEKHRVIDHHTFVLAGDGCMMEGITSEAASLAGHLGLGKLIVFYDSNHVTIDGSTKIAFTEDVLKRYDAYGWQTFSVNAYDVEGIEGFVRLAKEETAKPTIILLESIIGKGSPNLAGTSKVHGAALGAEELKATKKNLGLDENVDFYVDRKATEYFKKKQTGWKEAYERWNSEFSAWAAENPTLKQQWDLYFGKARLDKAELPAFKVGDKVATRNAGGKVENAIAVAVPNLVGGSADLDSSNKTAISGVGEFSREDRGGRNIHFGVREHAMGGISNGIALHGGFRPFAATFLVFADYMRPSIRLAALMGLPVIYVFTHDSIYVGEDGPTHQPVEQIQSLRIIPGVHVLRPGDAQETAVAWQMAIERTDGPTALALTRQNIVVYEKADPEWQEGCRKGAYVVQDCDGTPEVILVATGSEVGLAIEAAGICGKKVRVISMICRELFLKQEKSYREKLIPHGVRVVAAEAGVTSGWEAITLSADLVFGLSRFGESGKAEEVARRLGLTADALAKML